MIRCNRDHLISSLVTDKPLDFLRHNTGSSRLGNLFHTAAIPEVTTLWLSPFRSVNDRKRYDNQGPTDLVTNGRSIAFRQLRNVFVNKARRVYTCEAMHTFTCFQYLLYFDQAFTANPGPGVRISWFSSPGPWVAVSRNVDIIFGFDLNMSVLNLSISVTCIT